MPDPPSLKVNMADDDVVSVYRRRSGPTSTRRRWNCPGAERLAAYVDGTLGSPDRSRLEEHLAECDFCRSLISEVIKIQRSEAPPLPFGLLSRAIALVEAKPRRLRWLLVSTGVTITMAIAVITPLMLRNPELLVVRPPAVPTAPMIAKSEPPSVANMAGRDVVRKPRFAEALPSLTFPRAGSVVRRKAIEFKWKPVPRSRYYELRLAASDGDMIWQGETDRPALKLPSKIILKDGVYFVWVTAYLEDGREAKSVSVRFQVIAPQ